MSNPYITKKDLKEILDDYDFGGNKYSNGSAGGFAGDDKLGGWAKWINERVNSAPFNSSASSNNSDNKDSAAQSSSDVNSTQGSAFGGIFNSLGGRQNANGLFGSNSFITGIVLGAAATYFQKLYTEPAEAIKLINQLVTTIKQVIPQEMIDGF